MKCNQMLNIWSKKSFFSINNSIDKYVFDAFIIKQIFEQKVFINKKLKKLRFMLKRRFFFANFFLMLLGSGLGYRLYSTYNENLITKKRKWVVKLRRFSYKSSAIMKLYAILSRELWKKSSHKLYNSINRKTT